MRDFRFYANSENGTKVTVVGQHENNVLKIGVSRCTASDSFNKKKGVLIAEGRINKNKEYMNIPVEECNSKLFTTIAKGVAERVARTKIVY